MVKTLTFKERIVIMLFIFLVGILGGVLSFYTLDVFSPKVTLTTTERVTEKQVYVENSAAITSVKLVSQSLLTLTDKEDQSSINKRNGLFQLACFNGAANCQKIGVVLTSDGLIISAADIKDEELTDWSAFDFYGNQYQLMIVGKLASAKLYQLVKKGELDLAISDRSNFFNLKPIILSDSNLVQIGQNAFAVESAWKDIVKVTSGLIISKFSQIGTIKQINHDYLPVWLGFSDALKGSLVFDGTGGLMAVRTASGNISAEQISAFLKRYSQNNKDFSAIDLGVHCFDLDRQTATALSIKVDYGCLISEGLSSQGTIVNGGIVKNSLADKAGLKSNDVILEADNNTLLKTDFGQLILNKAPKGKVNLLILREGKTMNLTVNL